MVLSGDDLTEGSIEEFEIQTESDFVEFSSVNEAYLSFGYDDVIQAVKLSSQTLLRNVPRGVVREGMLET